MRSLENHLGSLNENGFLKACLPVFCFKSENLLKNWNFFFFLKFYWNSNRKHNKVLLCFGFWWFYIIIIYDINYQHLRNQRGKRRIFCTFRPAAWMQNWMLCWTCSCVLSKENFPSFRLSEVGSNLLYDTEYSESAFAMAAIYSYSIFIQSKTIALNFRQLDQTLRKVSLEAEGKKEIISSCWILRAELVSLRQHLHFSAVLRRWNPGLCWGAAGADASKMWFLSSVQGLSAFLIFYIWAMQLMPGNFFTVSSRFFCDCSMSSCCCCSQRGSPNAVATKACCCLMLGPSNPRTTWQFPRQPPVE